MYILEHDLKLIWKLKPLWCPRFKEARRRRTITAAEGRVKQEEIKVSDNSERQVQNESLANAFSSNIFLQIETLSVPFWRKTSSSKLEQTAGTLIMKFTHSSYQCNDWSYFKVQKLWRTETSVHFGAKIQIMYINEARMWHKSFTIFAARWR